MIHAVLYKVYIQDKYESQYNQFETTEIMNEHNFREFYKHEAEVGHIHLDNFEDKNISPTDNPNDIELSTILELLNDNDGYAPNANSYFVQQIDIELNDEDIC